MGTRDCELPTSPLRQSKVAREICCVSRGIEIYAPDEVLRGGGEQTPTYNPTHKHSLAPFHTVIRTHEDQVARRPSGNRQKLRVMIG